MLDGKQMKRNNGGAGTTEPEDVVGNEVLQCIPFPAL